MKDLPVRSKNDAIATVVSPAGVEYQLTIDGQRKQVDPKLTSSVSTENRDNKLADVLTTKEQKILPLSQSLRQDVDQNPGKAKTDPSAAKKLDYVDIMYNLRKHVEDVFPKAETEMRNQKKNEQQKDIAL